MEAADPGGLDPGGLDPGAPDSGAPDSGAPDSGAHHDPDLARLASRTPSRAADLISAVVDPSVVVVLVLLIIALRVSDSAGAGLKWFALTTAFVAGLPLLALAVFVRKGWVHDRHVVVRSQRHRLHVVAILSVALGLLALWAASAPHRLLVAVLAMLADFIVVALSSLVSKVSGHTTTISGAASLLAVYWTPWTLLVTAPLVLAVAWARIRAGRHSVAQVLAGAVLGAGVTLLVVLGVR